MFTPEHRRKRLQTVSCPTCRSPCFLFVWLLVWLFTHLCFVKSDVDVAQLCPVRLSNLTGIQPKECWTEMRLFWDSCAKWDCFGLAGWSMHSAQQHIDSCFLMAPINWMGIGCTQASVVSSEKTGYMAHTALVSSPYGWPATQACFITRGLIWRRSQPLRYNLLHLDYNCQEEIYPHLNSCP